jgi:Protein of unknown function (DUF1569)
MKTLARPEDKTEVLRRLRDVRPDSTRRWGRMSAPQMVCHLGDAFLIALGRKEVSHVPGILNHTVVKWIALYAPLRWPPGIVTRPEIDQALTGCTKPGDFGADVEQVEALVGVFTSRGPGVTWPSHPIFGTMSEGDWLRWGYLHMDHHLRQFGA